MIDRNLYRYAEDALRDYEDDRKRLELLDAYLSASSASEVRVQGGEAISEQERIVERKMKNEELRGLAGKTAAVQSFWDALSAMDRALVRLRYFERRPWSQVAEELRVSEQACRCRWAPRLIKRAAKYFFGDLAKV